MRFIEAILAIAQEAEEQPELVKTAPHTTRIGRIERLQLPAGRCCVGSRKSKRPYCPSIQTSPSSKNSFFQMGTTFLSLSMA